MSSAIMVSSGSTGTWLEVDNVPRLEDLLQRLLPGLVEGDGVGQVADNEVGQHLLQCEQQSTDGFL